MIIRQFSPGICFAILDHHPWFNTPNLAPLFSTSLIIAGLTDFAHAVLNKSGRGFENMLTNHK